MDPRTECCGWASWGELAGLIGNGTNTSWLRDRGPAIPEADTDRHAPCPPARRSRDNRPANAAARRAARGSRTA